MARLSFMERLKQDREISKNYKPPSIIDNYSQEALNTLEDLGVLHKIEKLEERVRLESKKFVYACIVAFLLALLAQMLYLN